MTVICEVFFMNIQRNMILFAAVDGSVLFRFSTKNLHDWKVLQRMYFGYVNM